MISNKKTIVETREIEIKQEYDVIIAGGGIAGIAAALSAKRTGVNVLIVEKSAILGGLSTLGLVNWYEPLCDGVGNVMTTGIAEELLQYSVKYGYDTLPDQWRDGGELTNPRKRYGTFFNPSIFALALNKLMMDEGIEVRYDMLASYPVMKGNVCEGIIVESKSGREFFPCKVVIDATGDSDIAFRAGVPCRLGKNYLTYYGHGCTTKSLKKAIDSGDMFGLNDNVFGIGSDMYGKGHPEGVPTYTGISGEIASDYIKTGQKLLFEEITDRPLNEQCLYTLPNMPQLRKTRCIVGDETFIGTDGEHSESSIGATGDFRKRDRHFEIPLGTLYNSDYPNILAAGRIVSADGDGWEITRVIPTAALTGQAAGVLASLSVLGDINAPEVPVAAVQAKLKESNVKLHF